MIERLLAAERAFEGGQLEVAERLYAQVEAADPRNAIAMTGRAKVAQAQGDADGARRHVARALETDPDDRMAQALATSLEDARAATAAVPTGAAPAAAVPAAAAPAASAIPRAAVPAPPPALVTAPGSTEPPRRSLRRSIGAFVRRLLGR